MNDIGWVHCWPVAAWYWFAYCRQVIPSKEDVHGMPGVHHASVSRFSPSGPRPTTTLGNRMALAMQAIRGLYPMELDCFQNVAKSGGSGQPWMISAPEDLYLLMIVVKSVAPSEYAPGLMTW